MLKYFLIFLFIFSFLSFTIGQSKTRSFKVMTWNILHGGRDIENGPQEVMAIIKNFDPDIICMVET